MFYSSRDPVLGLFINIIIVEEKNVPQISSEFVKQLSIAHAIHRQRNTINTS